jgi:peptidoglycan hydrolase CwlO-like protein
MKKWLIGLLTALLLATFTLPVLPANGINARLNGQQQRINRLADSGRISHKEQHRLQRELNHIRSRSQDPTLSHKERHRLQRQMDRLDDQINRAKHHHRH